MMNKPKMHYEPLKLAFVLLPRYSMIAFSSLIEPIRIANRIAGVTHFEWRCYSLDGKPVKASNEIITEVNGSVRDLDDASLTLVCSGVDVEQISPDQELGKHLRYLIAHGRMIGAACTGAHILAKFGLLDSCRCTIHWENIPFFREAFPTVEVTEDLYAIDRNRWTCAGGTAGIDMMLKFIATNTGISLAKKVAEVSLHQDIRIGAKAQRHDLRYRLGTANPNLIRAVETMENNIEDPLKCHEIARDVNLSTRHLERLFHSHFNQSPGQYYLRVRLEKSRDMLRRTEHSNLEVAVATGFSSTSHLTRSYKKFFGHGPNDERGR